MSQRGKQPEVGASVTLIDGEERTEATVRDLLSEQFTTTHEVRRPDGGWNEITSFRFYRDHDTTWN